MAQANRADMRFRAICESERTSFLPASGVVGSDPLVLRLDVSGLRQTDVVLKSDGIIHDAAPFRAGARYEVTIRCIEGGGPGD
jgi:hypothetical protein